MAGNLEQGRSKISKSAERISQLAEKQARELEWNEDSFQSMFAVVTHITGDISRKALFIAGRS